MFKNIIIAVLVVVILNLLVQNKQNVDILVNDMASAKQKIDRATVYLEDVIDENFGPNEFEVKDNLDIPSLQIQKEPFSEGSDIKEDTFFEDK
jgi:hypothetical protein